MFMIDMVGTRDFATASSSSRTPGERYCGSCIASPIRSKSFGLISFGPEADTLLAKLAQAEARDLFIRLTWDGDADYDLAVEEPLGATASYQTPRTVFGGSLVKNGYGSHPEEVYVCPRGFDGDYKVRITTIYTNPSKPVTHLTLETIAHEFVELCKQGKNFDVMRTMYAPNIV